jgi:acetyl esterase/lipase
MNKLQLLLLVVLPAIALAQTQKLPLYPGAVPNSQPTNIQETSAETGGISRISNVSVPELWYYPAQGAGPQKCVIICPGGGYNILAINHEGTAVAQELNKWGITAFVLKYRIPRDHAQPNKAIAPLQDAQQAIRYVRTYAQDYNIKPNKIGIMGFSAGGHLASTAATHFAKPVGGTTDTTSVRPNFAILCYPVISFGSFGHRGSAEALLGKTPSADMIAHYSNENHVTAQTPATFLVHAGDDKAVPVKNSIAFYEALLAHNVPAEMHIYPGGGHGFGMHNKTTNDQWMERLKNWLEKQ